MMDIHISGLSDSDLRKVRDHINEMLGEDSVWPKDEYCVPPQNADLDASSEYGTRTKYTNPTQYDAMFYMPPAKHDFPCHDCDGQYGPWVHAGFQINVDGGYHEKPIYANILQKRYRWCEDCGREFFNCYAVGKVHFERDEQGILSFEEFKDE